MKEWMAQAAPLRKRLQLKTMNDRSLLLSINEITHFIKKMDDWKLCFEKSLFSLQKRDASNRSF